MIAKTFSATVLGIDAYLIEVEVDVSVGMSVFNIVGLPDGTIKESRNRILSAVNNSRYSFYRKPEPCNGRGGIVTRW